VRCDIIAAASVSYFGCIWIRGYLLILDPPNGIALPHIGLIVAQPYILNPVSHHPATSIHVVESLCHLRPLSSSLFFLALFHQS
jgi:hypothetical protein